VADGAETLIRSLDDSAEILEAAYESGLVDGELAEFCHGHVKSRMEALLKWCGVPPEADSGTMEKDLLLNAHGIAACAARLRKKQK
jgi:hypothetical protein